MEKYRILKKGEIIQDGDDVDVSNGFNDPPVWQKTKLQGSSAPDPLYPAHRVYRRKVSTGKDEQ